MPLLEPQQDPAAVEPEERADSEDPVDAEELLHQQVRDVADEDAERRRVDDPAAVEVRAREDHVVAFPGPPEHADDELVTGGVVALEREHEVVRPERPGQVLEGRGEGRSRPPVSLVGDHRQRQVGTERACEIGGAVAAAVVDEQEGDVEVRAVFGGEGAEPVEQPRQVRRLVVDRSHDDERGHAARRRRSTCHSIVRRRPVSRSTLGTKPSSSRARVRSGSRRETSS